MARDAKGNYYAPAKLRAEAGLASAARTATGTGTAFDAARATALEVTLAVTAASGTTPTLDLALQTSVDGGTTWQTVKAFSQKTGTTTDVGVFGPLGSKLRWSWTIGGTTPSFTFTVTAKERT